MQRELYSATLGLYHPPVQCKSDVQLYERERLGLEMFDTADRSVFHIDLLSQVSTDVTIGSVHLFSPGLFKPPL